jgi:trehalose 6-phosphate phosphatase
MDDIAESLLGTPIQNAALFLEFDGTLIDIADAPDAIVVSGRVKELLENLQHAPGDAVALVTGRSIKDIASYLPDAAQWIAGCHGGERLMPGKAWTHPLTDSQQVRQIQNEIAGIGSKHDRLVTEAKPLGAVVHYRAVPDLQHTVRDAAFTIWR